MGIATLPNRPKYQPSGRVALPQAVLSAMVLFPIALLCGVLLAGTGQFFYLMLVSPAVATALVALPGYYLMRFSHCRSPAFAGALLGGLGVVVYLFQFPVELSFHFGPQAFLRPDAWLTYMVAAVNNWQIGDAGGQNNGNAVPVFNWVFFVVELGVSAIIPGAAGALAASSCYCERCGKWMTKKTRSLPAGTAVAVVQALGDGKLADLQVPTIQAGGAGNQSSFDVEGCSHGGLDHEATFYLTAREVQGAGDKMKVTALLQNALLTPDEFLQLIERCPTLAG
jgi:hypothetical protein